MQNAVEVIENASAINCFQLQSNYRQNECSVLVELFD